MSVWLFFLAASCTCLRGRSRRAVAVTPTSVTDYENMLAINHVWDGTWCYAPHTRDVVYAASPEEHSMRSRTCPRTGLQDIYRWARIYARRVQRSLDLGTLRACNKVTCSIIFC